MYSGPGGSGVLIEGVVDMRAYGSVPLGGLFDGVFGTNEVGCFAENDSTVWTNPNGAMGCDYFTLRVEELPEKMLNVALHPNPANDVLNITVVEPIQYAVTLRDLAGKRLVHDLNAQRIDVGTLAVGAYLIEVRTVDGQRVFRDKVIVTR
ncbi:MAG: T9SS type A sorting domain-containing protein [Flavobacteriales bacterium]